MTPAARLQAAIELLERSEAGAGPLDRLLADHFRTRRYAGSKDRRAVAERIYAIMRRKARLIWVLGAEQPPARQLVMADLAIGDGLPTAEIENLFDGAGYGPAVLSSSEKALLDDLTRGRAEPPEWVRDNHPEWLRPSLEQRFGGAIGPEMAAFRSRAPLDLRVNRLRAGRDEVRQNLGRAGIEASDTPYSRDGLRIADPVRLENTEAFREGNFEIQDEGSQIAAALVAAEPGMQVLDLCAGGGGKTLALAAAMGNRGQIFAVDTERRRLGAIKARLDRAGVRNTQYRLIGDEHDPWLEQFAGTFDRVLVDAPCSGTGTLRRNPERVWRMSGDDLSGMTDLQARLAVAGAGLVRPGGRLIYVTCSILPQENEGRIAALLQGEGALKAVPVTEIWGRDLDGQCPASGPYLNLSPFSTRTDGYFVAVLEKSRLSSAP